MVWEKSCGIIIFREQEKRFYLVLQYRAGHWGFPKGHVEKGEEEKETVLRELEEETGISEVEFIPGYRQRIDYYFYRGEQKINKEVYFYLGKTSEKKVQISHEHRDYKWLTYEEAMATLTFQNARNILKEAKQFLQE